MLKRQARISRSLFAEILKSRIFANSKHLTLRVGVSSGESKFAVSVSKKVSKSAVARNTLRRRIYSTIRTKVNPGLYLFIVKTGAGNLKGQGLEQEISLLLKPFERG